MQHDSVITSQMRAAIGVASEPTAHDVEAGAIRRFADAIGDPNPLYRDEPAARESRYGGIVAPPHLLAVDGPRPPDRRAAGPLPRAPDGGSDWEFFEPVRPGDTITVTSRGRGAEGAYRQAWADALRCSRDQLRGPARQDGRGPARHLHIL